MMGRTDLSSYLMRTSNKTSSLSSSGHSSEEARGIVLVIDDDPGIRSLIEECLTQWGYLVSLAHDGVEGVNLFRENRYSMVISNYTMPGLSGTEVCRALRSIDPKVPILMVSGQAQEQIDFGDERPHLAGFLQKPFSLADLQTGIEQAFSGSLEGSW